MGGIKHFVRAANHATATGGHIVYARKSGVTANLCSTIAEEARYTYTIVYAPTGEREDSDFHAVRVTVASGGLPARAEATTRTLPKPSNTGNQDRLTPFARIFLCRRSKEYHRLRGT
jgi:hypothetical protein